MHAQDRPLRSAGPVNHEHRPRTVHLSLWAWYNFKGVVSWVSVTLEAICIAKSRWKFESCPLSGIKKRPLLGG